MTPPQIVSVRSASAKIGLTTLPNAPERPPLSRPILSVIDLAQRLQEPGIARAAALYAVETVPAARRPLSDSGWTAAYRRLRAPRELIEEQELVVIRHLFLGTQAVYNPVAYGAHGTDQLPLAAAPDCLWCGPCGSPAGPWEDAGGEVVALGGRVVTRTDLLRRATVSGVAFGDRSMHAAAAMNEADHVALWSAAEEYARRERGCALDTFFAFEFTAAGGQHARVRILGQSGRHFPYPKAVASHAPADYWQLAEQIHRELGLSLREGDCLAWVSLAPAGQAEVFVHSPTLALGAPLVLRMLQSPTFRAHDVTISAYSAPGGAERYAGWPPVVWRLVASDRSEPGQGVTSFVRLDPFRVILALRGDAT